MQLQDSSARRLSGIIILLLHFLYDHSPLFDRVLQSAGLPIWAIRWKSVAGDREHKS